MQALTRHLATLLYEKKQFKIKFQQYDDGKHIFYPNYYNCRIDVSHGDLIAWMWGNSLKIGLVKVIKRESIKVVIVGRQKHKKKVQTALDKRQLICIFQPDS